MTLIPNSLHILEQNLLSAAVIEFRRATVGAAGDPLGYFQRSSVLQKIRDACTAAAWIAAYRQVSGKTEGKLVPFTPAVLRQDPRAACGNRDQMDSARNASQLWLRLAS
jgi:hypothetical protein